MGQLKEEKEEEPEGEVLGKVDTGSLLYFIFFLFHFTDPIFIGIVCVGLLIILFLFALSQMSQRKKRKGLSPRRKRILMLSGAGRGRWPPSLPGRRGEGAVVRGETYSHVSLFLY